MLRLIAPVIIGDHDRFVGVRLSFEERPCIAW
jgi:hypothetical protein